MRHFVEYELTIAHHVMFRKGISESGQCLYVGALGIRGVGCEHVSSYD